MVRRNGAAARQLESGRIPPENRGNGPALSSNLCRRDRQEERSAQIPEIRPEIIRSPATVFGQWYWCNAAAIYGLYGPDGQDRQIAEEMALC